MKEDVRMRKTSELANMEANEQRMAKDIKVADLVRVTAFDEGRMTVDVKPLVKREISGTYVSPPPILGVKVAHIPYTVATEVEVDGKKGTGKGTVSPTVSPGDLGVVVYLDLDSDSSIRTGGESQPNSCRMHSGDDAVFVGIISAG